MISTVAIYCFLFGSQMLLVGDALKPAWLIPGRAAGILLIAVGAALGWIVARSFSEKRWGDNLVEAERSQIP